jgi:SAM-dependent methyltransferase
MNQERLRTSDDVLVQHLQRVPPFRALIRAQEHRLFATERLERPVLDIGIGDGHFAAVVFPEGIDAGIDITWPIVVEGTSNGRYDSTAVADGTRLPYRDGAFRTVVSNCVVEHIPDAEGLVGEVARVLAPGGRYIFSTINDHFTDALGTVRRLDSLGLAGLAQRYGHWWNRRAAHFHFDTPQVYRERLARWGLHLDRHAYYMSSRAMGTFELLHYYAVPSLAWHRLASRWSLRPGQARESLAYRWLSPYAAEPEPTVGACSFYVAHKGNHGVGEA